MYVFHEVRDRLRRWFGHGRVKNTRVRRVLLGALFFAMLTLVLSTQLTPERLDVKAGDVATKTLPAPRAFENQLATIERVNAARAAVPIQQKIDLAVYQEAADTIDRVFTRINTIRALPNQDLKTKVETLSTDIADLKLGSPVTAETLAAVLSTENSNLDTSHRDATSLIDRALKDRRLTKEEATDVRNKIDVGEGNYAVTTRDPSLRTFVKELVKSRVRTNLVDDPEATKKLQEQAAIEVQPVMWQKDQTIIKQGELITKEQYAALQYLGLVGARANFQAWFGTALLSGILIAVMALYLVRYRPDIWENDTKLSLLGIIGMFTLFLAILMKAFNKSLAPGDVAYLMPIAVNSVLVTVLLEPKVALLQSVLLALMAGLSTPVDQLSHALVAVVGSTVGVYSVARVESRSDIYRAGLLVSAANVVTVLSVFLVQAYSLLDSEMWINVGLGALNGLVVAVLVTGALPLFENLFGVVTPLKLLELSNPNQPLLKKLLVEAPGSYHHTILVANLCEAAAEAIGADQVLARVGAYYHDIGKTKRPYFFVENQFGGENPHDKLPPSLSAMIITSHVKDGVEMAKEVRLPQEIIDFITEHHGTTLVSYFYHMASKNGQSEYVLEEDFRYDGPTPRSRETAILMLADGVEASVRAMRQKGPLTVDQIEAHVKRMIEDRQNQGQLDTCDLTLRDLDVIAKTFVKVLSGVHHARIEYPPEAMEARVTSRETAPSGSAEGENANGGVDQQRSGTGPGDSGTGNDGPTGSGEGSAPGGAAPGAEH